MKYTGLLGVCFIFTILILSTSLPYQAVAQKGGPDLIPGRYIVVLEDGVSPQDVTRGHGVVPEFVYSYAINGFAGPISPVALEELKQDPRVLHIEQDQKMYAFAQTPPTGIDRMDAEPSDDSNLGNAVTIAIIDTGIDLDHPDLNVVHSIKCAKGGPFGSNCSGSGDDDNGHGTHVAGTAAGVNNLIGVVGVAPGADLWAVKVLDSRGSGYISWIVAGIDYVTANADVVDVANMSLGCECSSSALDNAITASVAAGVTYVVAAGNSDKDASTFSPANHQDVITVSALADSNGMCGGGGGNTSYGADDTLATFSNYGDDVEIAGPGVDIYSTLPGGYGTYSGTSMASPHVAGAAALIVADNPLFTPSQVLTALLNNSVPQGQACNGDGDGGFSEYTGDGSPEPLVYVGNTSVGDPPIVSITDPADNSEFHVGVNDNISFTGTASDAEDDDTTLTTNLDWTSDIDGSIGGGGSFLATLSEGSHTVTASVTDDDGNSASSSITVNVVNDPPIVSIDSPADDSTFDSGANISFTGTASDTEDGNLTGNISWTSSLDGNLDTGGSFSTILSDGTHTIIAEVMDSQGVTGSSSISITVGTPPVNPTVSVSSIDYTPSGGKDGNKHLDVTVTILDESSNPVSGASVYVEISLEGDLYSSQTGITETNGSVTFSLKNSPVLGHYVTDVTNVDAAGFDFVDVYDDPGFDK